VRSARRLRVPRAWVALRGVRHLGGLLVPRARTALRAVRPARGLVVPRAWVAAALLVLLAPAAARAEAVTGAQLRDLAARAADEPAALERLRGVDRVDGRPADLGRALDTVGAELEARLAALRAAPGAGGDAAAARGQAQDILGERRFTGTEVPGPFRGALEQVADWIAPVLDLVPSLDDLLPGGRPVVWALLLLVVGGLAAAVAARSLRRRPAGGRAGAGSAGPGGEDPDTLERLAREAAARGEHELALRLGFRAGVARLDLGPSRSTGEVARTLRSPDFDRAAARFDEVVYGGRPAAAADVDAARAAWEAALSGRRAA
jgi:hypothetical protein